MRVVLIGSGAVGSAIAAIVARRTFIDHLVVADVDLLRAQEAAAGAAEGGIKSYAERVDASRASDIAALLRRHRADFVVNACDPRLNPAIFAAAFASGTNYLDMAMNLSQPHARHPHTKLGVPLGDEQTRASPAWADRGLLALVAMGADPGLSNVFARHAADQLFSRVDEIGIRDGSNLVIDGYEFAPTFSIWTTIEECLNPPIVYERDRGWFTTEPFSEPEIFDFPAGIGPVECVNVEHEEVLLIPRVLDVGRVTFKYGLGRDFIDVLRTLHRLGMDQTRRVRVGGVEVSPRDVVAATLPDPSTLGARMHGKTCVGTSVRGLDKAGEHREVFLYHVVDNADSMREYGCQAVGWQTAINPVIALELVASGQWNRVGVHGGDAFDAAPFLAMLASYGAPHGILELGQRLVAA